MTAKYHQISLSDIFSDYQDKLIDNSPAFFLLLSQYVDLEDFIPAQFQFAFHLSLGRNRVYSLHGFLTAFILQKIFSIPTDSLLSRFKRDFEPYLELMFQRMVDFTEPICQAHLFY